MSIYRVLCSIFFEKEAFFCEPEELGSKETGGVAVLRGRKVTRAIAVSIFTFERILILLIIFLVVFKVVNLDVSAKKVKLDDGTYVGYEKCLLATGGKPKNLTVIEEAGPEVAEHVTLFRNVRQHDIKLRWCCQL